MEKLKILLASIVLVVYALMAGASVDDNGNLSDTTITILVIVGVLFVVAVIAAIISIRKSSQQKALALKEIPSTAKQDCLPTQGDYFYDASTNSVYVLTYDEKNFDIKKYDNIVKTISYAHEGHYFLLDEENQQILYAHSKMATLGTTSKVIPFAEIAGVDISENGNSVFQKSTASAVGRAIVGGVLLGGVGAVIGGVTGKNKEKKTLESYNITIQMTNMKEPSYVINLVDESFELDDSNKAKYEAISKFANNIKATLLNIIKANEAKLNLAQAQVAAVLNAKAQQQMLERKETQAIEPEEKTSSVADEIKKLSELHKTGVLTDEEFEEQKRKLLNK